MFEPNQVLKVLNGRGTLSAEGLGAIKIRYKVVIERRDGAVLAHGSITGSHAALRPFWLTPDATLHLQDGGQIEISLTDLIDDTAEFESTGRVAPV